MMKKTGLLALIFFLTAFADNNIVDKARIYYSKAADDKSACNKIIKELEENKNPSALLMAYLGGYKTIWANHVLSPIAKLKTFKEGKKLIDEAVERESNNIEIRFIRLSVQKNAPAFLGYKSHVEEDEEFIRKNRNAVNSEIISENIDAILKQ